MGGGDAVVHPSLQSGEDMGLEGEPDARRPRLPVLHPASFHQLLCPCPDAASYPPERRLSSDHRAREGENKG